MSQQPPNDNLYEALHEQIARREKIRVAVKKLQRDWGYRGEHQAESHPLRKKPSLVDSF
jgi:hypothetical protein